MTRNTPGQTIGGQMVSASDGSAYVGTVTVYITIDGGVQTIGSVGSGICAAEGNGYYTYEPAQAETNGSLIAFTFIGAGAIPQTVQVATVINPNAITVSGTTSSSTTKTVADMLKACLLRINVIQSGEEPSAEDLAIAFDRFNDWIDSVCANERLTIYTIARTTWTLTSGKQDYTVGAGGDVNIVRPIFIDRVNFIDTSFNPTLELPLVTLTDQTYQLVPNKAQTTTYPYAVYYNPTFPLGTLSFFYIPTSGTLEGCLYTPAAVTRFGATSDTIALPPGYNRFIRDNVAVELAAEFRENVPVDPNLQRSAMQSKDNIKIANMRPEDLRIPRDVPGQFGWNSNIYTGL